MAYAATGSAVYASHINSALYTFFIDQTSLMNPNLNYAQVVRGPGNQTGDREGVLDGETLTKIAAGVEVIRKSGAPEWESTTENGISNWAGEMITWLTTSVLGVQERVATKSAVFSLNRLKSDHADPNRSVITDLITSTKYAPFTS